MTCGSGGEQGGSCMACRARAIEMSLKSRLGRRSSGRRIVRRRDHAGSSLAGASTLEYHLSHRLLETASVPPANDVLERLAQAESAGSLSASAAANIRRWLSEPPFEKYRPRLLEDLQARNWKTLDDAFYAVLEFGTGGRRGKMYPIGTNVLNERTMAESARGLADYIAIRQGQGTDGPYSCAIARDTRHNSPEFAELCARVLAAAGFKVYLFPEPRSTPLLSLSATSSAMPAS